MNQAIIDSKKAVVSEIAQKMKESQSTVVVEYRGLSVAEVTELRRNLREEGVEFKVYKNSLAQRAAVEAGADDLTKDLIGPNAIAFGGDAVAPARVLAKFAMRRFFSMIQASVSTSKNSSPLRPSLRAIASASALLVGLYGSTAWSATQSFSAPGQNTSAVPAGTAGRCHPPVQV